MHAAIGACPACLLTQRQEEMAKRNGNRELKKPKQNKPKGSGASSVAELAKAAAAVGRKRP